MEEKVKQDMLMIKDTTFIRSEIEQKNGMN